eukprot:6979684-Prymnesium_polylepis.1
MLKAIVGEIQKRAPPERSNASRPINSSVPSWNTKRAAPTAMRSIHTRQSTARSGTSSARNANARITHTMQSVAPTTSGSASNVSREASSCSPPIPTSRTAPSGRPRASASAVTRSIARRVASINCCPAGENGSSSSLICTLVALLSWLPLP